MVQRGLSTKIFKQENKMAALSITKNIFDKKLLYFILTNIVLKYSTWKTPYEFTNIIEVLFLNKIWWSQKYQTFSIKLPNYKSCLLKDNILYDTMEIPGSLIPLQKLSYEPGSRRQVMWDISIMCRHIQKLCIMLVFLCSDIG